MQFEIVAKRNDWDDNEKVDFLKCTLIGEASHVLRDLSDSATYDDVVYKLRQRYGSIEQIERFRMELKQRRRKPGESLSILLKDVRRLFSQAYTGPHNYLSELMAVDAFVEALNDRELKIKVLEREPSSLDQAYKIAERMELYQNIPDEKVAESRPKQAVKVRATAADDESMLKSVVETQRLMQKQLALLTESVNKDRTPARKSGDVGKQSSGKSKGPCHHRGKPEHYRFECPELAQKPHGTKEPVTTIPHDVPSNPRADRVSTVQSRDRVVEPVLKEPEQCRASVVLWLTISPPRWETQGSIPTST